MARIGILPLGRPTFDVPYAEQNLAEMLSVLEATGHDIIGPRELLFDADQTRAAMDDLEQARPEYVLILQVTFTDAVMAVAIADRFAQPLGIWAIPEPRIGGRLRLNSFCGLNLASHALGRNGRVFGWIYAAPDRAADDLQALLDGTRQVTPVEPQAQPTTSSTIADALKGKRIAQLGAHPDGFDTCAYDGPKLKALTGITVDSHTLETLFDTARDVPVASAQALRATASEEISGLEEVDQAELDRSLRLKIALDHIRQSGRYDAFAIRCWPETFTEYGGAVCGPVSMLGEARVPCACEADVYGAVTQLILQEAAQAPVFLVDLVDMDVADDTGVVWHCGQAPLSMAAKPAQATIHTNRKMPLLYEFPLKAGDVTFVRLSQAHGVPQMILSYGQMLDRPMAFTGTSGVVRFHRPVQDVLPDLMNSGLEHHMALAYGDHRNSLRDVAGALGLPVLEI